MSAPADDLSSDKSGIDSVRPQTISAWATDDSYGFGGLGTKPATCPVASKLT